MTRLSLLIVLLASTVATAQTEKRFEFATVGFGTSTGTPGGPSFNDSFVSLAADYHADVKGLYVRGGVSHQSCCIIFGGDEVTEGHLAFGLAHQTGPALLTLSAGPTLAYVVRSTYRNDSPQSPLDRTEGPGLGAHVSAAVHLAVVQEVALGLEAFANVNTQTPIAGARLTFGLGRLPRPLIPLPSNSSSRTSRSGSE
ncbi:hypothetical protein [Rubrivirga sp.]|uniref:hypothetical protein n=1 Tax=Rubrivirga sp. TaxID=1885344 RepID=UPI003C768620